MRSLDRVRDYFNREATRFDSIYEDRKPWHQQIIDRTFRAVVLERFHLICNLAPSAGVWTALDVGCGPGRYAIALARQGATRVVGIDVAEEMIRLARAQAAEAGVAPCCHFETSAFLDYQTTEQFDTVIATGYLDYLEDPVPHLRKMLQCCRGKVFASVPKRWEFRVPARKVRFAVERGYVRFYSRAELLGYAEQAGAAPDRISLIDLGRDWVAVIRA